LSIGTQVHDMTTSRREKEGTEKWVAERFAEILNGEVGTDFRVDKRGDWAPGPDWILKSSDGREVGVEVTEVLKNPSSKTGEQREKIDRLWHELDQLAVESDRLLSFRVEGALPVSLDELGNLASELGRTIREEPGPARKRSDGSWSARVGPVSLIVHGPGHPAGAIIADSFLGGVDDEEYVEKVVVQLGQLIESKDLKSANYDNSRENHLAINLGEVGVRTFVSLEELSEALECQKERWGGVGGFKGIWVIWSRERYWRLK